jgi:hypothetical protein
MEQKDISAGIKKFLWEIRLGAFLVGLSCALFYIHFAIFRQGGFIRLYLLYDIAFIPVQILVISLIVEKVFAEREKTLMLRKLNMVISTFYNAIGTDLIRDLMTFGIGPEKISQDLVVKQDWTPRDFYAKKKALAEYPIIFDSRIGDLEKVRMRLIEERGFLLRLLENPVLLEHEEFTDMLFAVFHLADELSHRQSVTGLPETDYIHISTDMKRAYLALVTGWISYIFYLKQNYPYLFSLALRTNPFDKNASVIVK